MPNNLSLARHLIRKCIETKSPSLDLGYCGIADLNDIPELFECTHVKTLILCESWNDEQGNEFTSKYRYTDNGRNHFTELPGKLVLLKNIRNFICCGSSSSTRKIANIDILKEFTSLEVLALNNIELDSVFFLSNLINLRSLSIANNKITDARPLSKLVNLALFNVSNNKISDLSFLTNLTSLQGLNISENNFVDCNVLSNLANLEFLNLANNQVIDCSALANLSQLKRLNILNNRVRRLPLLLFKMKLEVPDVHTKKGSLLYDGNPIESPPLEILRQGQKSVLDWVEANRKKLNEIKMILIGDAKAGKTSLLRRLKDDTFNAHEPQTDGINIEHIAFGVSAPFKRQKSLHDITAHFWDFGGQEIMNATHQFFLTNRSVYILVLDARKDQKVAEQIRQWVKKIKTTGGTSPIIVVANQVDVNPAFGFTNEFELQCDYPQIKYFIKTTCALNNDVGIELIRQKLEQLIPQAELFNTEIDERWISIKAQLQKETEKHHYLNEQRFNQICDNNRLQKEGRKNAINFLHDLGLILHFENLSQNLADYFVLDPYWITYGVYQILTSRYAGEQKGVVPMDMLDYILNEEEDKRQTYQPSKYRVIKYDSTTQRRFLVDILNQFKLCFTLPGNTHFIIPDLLDTLEPSTDTQKIREAQNSISFVYEYEYLPNSILPNIMVEAHSMLPKLWRTGCLLQYNDCKALISSYQNRLTVTIDGEHKKKRELMAIVLYLINKINKDLSDKPNALIPLPGIHAFADYYVLLIMEQRGEQLFIHDKYKSTEQQFEISLLLEGIPRENEMKAMQDLFDQLQAKINRLEQKLDKHFKHLEDRIGGGYNEIVQAIGEISNLQATLVVQDVMQFITYSFETLRLEVDDQLKSLYKDLKSTDGIEMKLKLSIPLIKLLGIDLETKVDVKHWAKTMYKKHELTIFKLLT